MKTNKILVNGCSYTYGIGVTEDFGAPERKDLCWAGVLGKKLDADVINFCLLYTSPSPRDQRGSRMPSSA